MMTALFQPALGVLTLGTFLSSDVEVAFEEGAELNVDEFMGVSTQEVISGGIDNHCDAILVILVDSRFLVTLDKAKLYKEMLN
mmetsp:Transcript_15023/g.27312  ORF Transcript_15023/g.27312 Transcript_15023/m.27312 type:complete len:83 (-) Transcript_15023:663-911(-)